MIAIPGAGGLEYPDLAGSQELKVVPPPADAGIVIHGGSGNVWRICGSTSGWPPGPPSWAHRHCGRDGILPDRDHIADFLPRGSVVTHELDQVVITLGPHW